MVTADLVLNEQQSRLEQFWESADFLDNLLPYVAPDNSEYEHFCFECNGCKKPIPDNFIKARIARNPNWVETLYAQGRCMSCGLATEYVCRFRPEGSVEVMVGHDWRIFQIKQSPWFWRQINIFVKTLFN